MLWLLLFALSLLDAMGPRLVSMHLVVAATRMADASNFTCALNVRSWSLSPWLMLLPLLVADMLAASKRLLLKVNAVLGFLQLSPPFPCEIVLERPKGAREL